MNRPVTPRDEQTRASVYGRVVFGVSTLALAALLLYLLDRVGAPERLVASLGPLAALCALAALGLMLRCMRASTYYAAGRVMPPPWAGLATAGLLAALFAPILPPRPHAWSNQDVVLGFLFGSAIVALVTGPFLRRTGAYSVVDLLSARFPSILLRVCLVALICWVSMILAAAGFEAATRGLQTALSADRRSAVALAGVAILFMILPGGLSGVVWTALAAACVFLLGIGLPLALSLLDATGGGPGLADAAFWGAASDRLATWSVDAPDGVHPIVVTVCALGVGALAPVLAPAIATHDRRSATAGGRATMFWCFAIAALVAATLASSALKLDSATVGRSPDRLPDAVYAASARGLVDICGVAVASPMEAARACGAASDSPKPLRPSDVRAQGAFLLTAEPSLFEEGDSFAGLDAAGVVCLALALAAAAVQAAATALSHDLLYRARRSKPLASRRLALTRMIAVAAVVASACAIAAAAVAPLFLLTFWPRASAFDALVALIFGAGLAELQIGADAANLPIDRLAAAAFLSAVVATAFGLLTSLLRPPDTLRGGRAFFDRVAHGYGDVLNPDGGA